MNIRTTKSIVLLRKLCLYPRALRLNNPSVQFISTIPKCEQLEVVEKDHVFNVKLNRPESRNAFTLQLWKELRSVFDHLSDYSKCRAIVLSGNGKSFCAGLDLKHGLTDIIALLNDNEKDTARKALELRKFIEIAQGSYTSIEKCRKPVVAAIHSYCLGAGISLISCCDIRYASTDAVFSIKEVDVGLAADVGILQRVQKLVGNDSLTRELAYTGRNIHSLDALNYGLVSRLFESKDDCIHGAMSLAQEIASKSPVAVQGSKMALNYARNHSVEDSLEWIITWNQSQLQTEDLIINAMAKQAKQLPEFKDT
uniref:Delta(3,5)-Delta(2,4)-dienoyl-CoA isomerase, mitochondrial n=1 Tax=Acrobeloides nanus TaxID=290746 RepID=A0A914DWN4_9BILA